MSLVSSLAAFNLFLLIASMKCKSKFQFLTVDNLSAMTCRAFIDFFVGFIMSATVIACTVNSWTRNRITMTAQRDHIANKHLLVIAHDFEIFLARLQDEILL